VSDILANLPEVLTYTSEPDLVVGDIFVFENHRSGVSEDDVKWAAARAGKDGIKVPGPRQTVAPSVYIEITSIGRHKRGHWYAKFRVCGADKDEYMARGHGHTTTRHRAIDDVPVVKVVADPAKLQAAADMRDTRRLEELRRGLQHQMMRKDIGPGKLAVTVTAISDVERKMRDLQDFSEEITT
jgi:hypothetical protein